MQRLMAAMELNPVIVILASDIAAVHIVFLFNLSL